MFFIQKVPQRKSGGLRVRTSMFFIQKVPQRKSGGLRVRTSMFFIQKVPQRKSGGAPGKDIDVFHPESSPRPPLGELWIKDSLLQLPQIDSCP
jgi:hypothetical protein